MSEEKIAINQQDSLPGLSIYRPVLDLPEGYSEYLSQRLEYAGFTKNLVKVILGSEPKIVIIGTGELRSIQEKAEVPLTDESNEELAEYLNDSVPVSYDTVIKNIPILPLKYYIRKGKSDYLVLAAASKNPQIKKERKITQKIINEKYRLRNSTANTAWANTSYRTDLNIAWINNNRHFRSTRIPELQNFLGTLLRQSLPEKITLGLATIDDVNKKGE